MSIEAKVRAMTKAERREYLLTRGWTRLGPNTWLHWTFDEPGGDRGFYTLAAAIRAELRFENAE